MTTSTCPVCGVPVLNLLETGRLSIYCSNACKCKARRARQRELKAEQAGQQNLFNSELLKNRKTAIPKHKTEFASGVVVSAPISKAIYEPSPIIANINDLKAFFNGTHDKFYNDDAEGCTYVIR